VEDHLVTGALVATVEVETLKSVEIKRAQDLTGRYELHKFE
jgi:hypothetical protein